VSEATLIEGSRHTVRIARPSLAAMVRARPSPSPPPPPPPLPRASFCRLDSRLAILAEPDSARASAFRLLRDNILSRGLPRVLAITSAGPNEGKTTCAANLAFALAEIAPKKILLLDANFFAPALASMFSIDEYAPPWLAPMRLTSLTPCLDVATIALVRGEAFPRIDRACLVRVLGAFFQAGYEHVIVDAPAVDGSPAVAQLLDVATAVLFTARSGQTTKTGLRRARDQVASHKQLGVALVEDCS
jgi:Mrp family chromosome partitioning ATPase